MSASRRLAGAALGLLLPGLLLVRWTAALPPDAGPDRMNVLPRQIGAWHATLEQPLDPGILAAIAPAAYVQRRYEAEGRLPIWVYVGLYTARGAGARGAHDPEVCYPAQGWEVSAARALELPMEGERRLSVRLLDAHRDALRESVLFWFQPARRWPSYGLSEELQRLGDAFSLRPQYAFVRLSGPTDGSARASEELAEFAREIAPPLREIVESMSQRAPH